MAPRSLVVVTALLLSSGCGLLSQGTTACRSHAECAIDEVCLDGRCGPGDLAPGPIGPTSCTVADEALECGEGFYCASAGCAPLPLCTDGSCPSGLHCWSDALCRRDAPLECEDDEDCVPTDFCRGEKTCDPITNTCTPDVDPCPASAPFCDEALDTCHVCVVDGDCMDDGAFCSGEEVCLDNKCVSTGDPCDATSPFCDEANNRCVACQVSADCEQDALYCNGTTNCVLGSCVPGSSPCSGATPVCLEGGSPGAALDGGPSPLLDGGTADGGVAAPYSCVGCMSDEDCVDTLHCNGIETCVDGACESSGNPCPLGENCNESNDSCGACTVDAECDDTDFCTGQETCTDGVCNYPVSGPCAGEATATFCIEEIDACRECVVDQDCEQHPGFDALECPDPTCNDGVCSFPAQCDGINDWPNCAQLCYFPVGQFCFDVRWGCAECTEDTEFADCDNGEFCNTGVERCNRYDLSEGGQCFSPGPPCQNTANPYCNEGETCCVHCTQDSQCNDFNFCAGPEDCVNPGQCNATCMATGDPCLGEPVRDQCNPNAQRCDECLNDGHCQAPEPRCRTQTGDCVECTQNGHCNDDGQFCTRAPQCQSFGCIVPSGTPCNDPNRPLCDETNNDCRECFDDGDCPPERQFCNTQGTCRACLNAGHCANGQFCDGNELCQNGSCVDGPDPCPAGETCLEPTDACLPAGNPDGGP